LHVSISIVASAAATIVVVFNIAVGGEMLTNYKLLVNIGEV
jgi:hypothetical protein